MPDEMVPVADDHGASPNAAERSTPVEEPLGTSQAKDAESDTDETGTAQSRIARALLEHRIYDSAAR